MVVLNRKRSSRWLQILAKETKVRFTIFETIFGLGMQFQLRGWGGGGRVDLSLLCLSSQTSCVCCAKLVYTEKPIHDIRLC